MGILAIGKIKPDKIMDGIMTKIADIKAWRWVREIVEIKTPRPSVVVKKTPLKIKSSKGLPFMGTRNHKIATR